MFPFRRRMMFFQRGQFKYVVLRALKERPMHGYEIMQTIGHSHSGMYLPSPGIIYPTLQMLEDQGYVKGETIDGKRVYSITSEGDRFLEEGEKHFHEHLESRKKFFQVRAGLHEEIRGFAELFVEHSADLTPEKIEKVRQILKEARGKVAEALNG
jgi:DNA-binding PadR family transcriptional regulator